MAKKTEDEPMVQNLSEKHSEAFLASGIAEIDELVGGLPIGRITELWGSEGVGKTHLVAKMMAHVSQDKKVLLVDTEFAFNRARAEKFDVNMKNVDYLADARLERVCELLISSIGKYDLIILDSLAYLTPLTVENAEIGETAIGLFARLLKHWVTKFRPKLGRSKTTIVVVNQYRAAIGMFAKIEPPGGKAWAHAVDVRLYLTTNTSDRIISGGEQVGHWLNVEVKKSKVSQPFAKTKVRIDY